MTPQLWSPPAASEANRVVDTTFDGGAAQRRVSGRPFSVRHSRIPSEAPTAPRSSYPQQ